MTYRLQLKGMNGQPQRVEIYETSKGKSPFKTWLRELRDPKGRQAVRARIARVRLGNFGDHRSVGEGVIELRIHVGPGYRVYVGRDGEELVILLAAGDKSTQQADIAAAQGYWRDYLETKDAD